MANAIIILVLILVGSYALKRTLKHAKGGCCGGSNTIIVPDKKLTGTKLGEKVIDISGMSCEHCVSSVKKALNAIEGVSAQVSLNRHRAVISYDREVSEDTIRQTIEKLGFHVNAIN